VEGLLHLLKDDKDVVEEDIIDVQQGKPYPTLQIDESIIERDILDLEEDKFVASKRSINIDKILCGQPLSMTIKTIPNEEIENFNVQRRYDDTCPDLMTTLEEEALLGPSHDSIEIVIHNDEAFVEDQDEQN
jgi:hypothetical protein